MGIIGPPDRENIPAILLIYPSTVSIAWDVLNRPPKLRGWAKCSMDRATSQPLHNPEPKALKFVLRRSKMDRAIFVIAKEAPGAFSGARRGADSKTGCFQFC